MYDCGQEPAEDIHSHPLSTDGATAMDMLYEAYIAHSAIDSRTMACKFRQLEQRLSDLPPELENGIFQAFCEVYAENEKNAFCEGLRFGFQLAKELAEK